MINNKKVFKNRKVNKIQSAPTPNLKNNVEGNTEENNTEKNNTNNTIEKNTKENNPEENNSKKNNTEIRGFKYRRERRKEVAKEERKKVRRSFFEWVTLFLVGILVGIGITKYLVFFINVPTGSMIPTINIDDRIIVRKIYKPENLKRGEIVVFLSDEDPKDRKEKPFIKRLIGLPGDEVIIKDGVVSVNGTVLKEDYVKNIEDTYDGKFNVPEGKYFFLGDNRTGSYDSRNWENPFVDKSKIMAIAGLRIAPLKNFGLLK